MNTDTQTETEPLTLEQRFANVQRTLINEVNHHIQCQKDLSAMKAHADKLAEALRKFTEAYRLQSEHDLECAEAIATQALAAYEATQ